MGASRYRPAPNQSAITPDLWQYNAVDNVDHAVGGIKIGGGDMHHAAFAVGQHDGPVHYRCGQISTLDSGDNSLATVGMIAAKTSLAINLPETTW